MLKYILTIVGFYFMQFSFGQDTITNKQDIKAAANLFDIQFSNAEVDSMFGDVKDNQKLFQSMHRYDLNNNVPLSLWQTPVLPGMGLNKKQEPVKWEMPESVVMPKQKDDLAFYSIPQLAYLIKNKKSRIFAG